MVFTNVFRLKIRCSPFMVSSSYDMNGIWYQQPTLMYYLLHNMLMYFSCITHCVKFKYLYVVTNLTLYNNGFLTKWLNKIFWVQGAPTFLREPTASCISRFSRVFGKCWCQYWIAISIQNVVFGVFPFRARLGKPFSLVENTVLFARCTYFVRVENVIFLRRLAMWWTWWSDRHSTTINFSRHFHLQNKPFPTYYNTATILTLFRTVVKKNKQLSLAL